jgi:hypothetical protein
VELQAGRLNAALSHNMPASAGDGGLTEVRLSLALTNQWRVLMQQRGRGPLVLLQFSSG